MLFEAVRDVRHNLPMIGFQTFQNRQIQHGGEISKTHSGTLINVVGKVTECAKSIAYRHIKVETRHFELSSTQLGKTMD